MTNASNLRPGQSDMLSKGSRPLTADLPAIFTQYIQLIRPPQSEINHHTQRILIWVLRGLKFYVLLSQSHAADARCSSNMTKYSALHNSVKIGPLHVSVCVALASSK